MSKRQTNALWTAMLAVLFGFYHADLAGHIARGPGDSGVGFVFFPALLGLVMLIGVRGRLAVKLGWYLLMPVVPCIVLWYPAGGIDTGSGAALIGAMLRSYAIGGAVAWLMLFLIDRAKPPGARAHSGVAGR